MFLAEAYTGRFRTLGRCFIDWATAVIGEGDTCQLSVSFTYHSSGPIYETPAQYTKFDGTLSPPPKSSTCPYWPVATLIDHNTCSTCNCKKCRETQKVVLFRAFVFEDQQSSPDLATRKAVTVAILQHVSLHF